MEKRKKVIITGGTGYIGSNLAKYMLTQGWQVYLIVEPTFGYSNILAFKDRLVIFEYAKHDVHSLISFIKEVNADVVFHLAAAVITNYKPSDIQNLIQSNIQFGVEVLEAMKQSSTRMLVNTGTYWQNYNSESYNPVDLYAATKEAFEMMIRYYVEAHRFKVVTLKLYDVYGENDTRPKLINLLTRSVWDETRVDLSPGEQLLDLVHIADVCTAFASAYEYLSAKDQKTFETFAVATGVLATIKELVKTFTDLSGKEMNVCFGALPYRDRVVMKPVSVKRLPNWSARISMEEGVRTCLKSLVKERNHV